MVINKIAFQIIALLLQQRKLCYLREIAKKTQNSTSSVSRQLDCLKKEHVIKEQALGKGLFYALNFQNDLAQKYCEIVEIQKRDNFVQKYKVLKLIMDDVLKDIQNECLVNITIFGSVAKEQARKESDIDLLIITTKKQEYPSVIRKIHAEYGKMLSIISFTEKELQQRMNEPLIQQIIKDHIVFFGFDYFVAEVLVYE